MNNIIAFLRLVGYDDKRQWYCGYIGVEDDSKIPHSIQGDLDVFDDYDNSLDAQISVHGGITFDGKWEENTTIIPITDIPKNWYKYHCYGFDLHHCDDEPIAMDFEYAKQEVLSMKEQMEKLIEHMSSSTGD